MFNFNIMEISKSVFIKWEILYKDKEMRAIIRIEEEIIWMKK